MPRPLRAAALLLTGLVICIASSPAQMYQVRTHNMRLIYLDSAQAFLIPHIARSFENSLRFHRTLFDYTPSEHVTVLLHDFNDYGTGGTNTIPWNYLSLGIEPFDYVYETSPTNERFNWVMNHELVHVLATDRAANEDHFFRSIFFGKVSPAVENPISMFWSYLSTPRWYSPRWFHEGIASFMETWMAGGIGRALGGYDEMMFRTMVRDSVPFYDYLGLESEGTTIDFQIGANSYLYGTRFVSYLAAREGVDPLLRWMNRSEGSAKFFSTQFAEIYGKSLVDAWREWVEWEHAWQAANLDSVRQYPLTAYRPLTSRPLGSVSRAFADSTGSTFYVAMNLPGRSPALLAVDRVTGEEERLCTVQSPALYYVASTALDPSTGDLFYTTHNSSGWRDIRAVNVRTKDERLVIKNARIGDLAFNRADKSLWGVQHHNGYSTLVRLPAPYTFWQDILPLRYGKDLFDLDISPDGRFLSASLADVTGHQLLVRFPVDSLLVGDGRHDVLYDFDTATPMNFVYGPEGRYLYGSTYYTGVANLVRYDQQTKMMEWLSNTETGLFRPLPLPGDSLLAFRFTGKGFLPVLLKEQTTEDVSAIRFLGQHIVETQTVVKDWKLPPPSVVRLDSIIVEKGEYSPLSHMRLASLYPIVEGYKIYTAPGLRMTLQDELGVYTLNATASVTPQRGVPANERFHGLLELDLWQLHLEGSYNAGDFYDLFGPRRTSRKGYSAGISYKDYFLYDRPATLQWTLAAKGYWGLEVLPEYQNVPTSYDKFARVSGSLRYSHQTRSLGAVDYEQGFAWSLSLPTTFVRDDVIPRMAGTLDFGFPALWNHNSVWFRFASGFGVGDRDEPFANYYFGGFENNIVDHQEIRRYRDISTFPGVDINELGGRTFFKGMVEWTLPPLRFTRFGFSNLYCNWARVAIFGGAVVTNLDDPELRQRAVNLGIQLDLRIVLFSNLGSTLSFGYAVSGARGRAPSREGMISLRILG